jgi:hypothetical protein
MERDRNINTHSRDVRNGFLNFGSVLKKPRIRFDFVGKPRIGSVLLQISYKAKFIVETSYYCMTVHVVCHFFYCYVFAVLDAGAESHSSAKLKNCGCLISVFDFQKSHGNPNLWFDLLTSVRSGF